MDGAGGKNSRSTAVSDHTHTHTHIWCKSVVTYRTARRNKGGDKAASSRQLVRSLPPKTSNRHPLNCSPMLTLVLFDCLTLFSNTNNEFYDYSSLESCSTVEEGSKWPCAKINWRFMRASTASVLTENCGTRWTFLMTVDGKCIPQLGKKKENVSGTSAAQKALLFQCISPNMKGFVEKFP